MTDLVRLKGHLTSSGYKLQHVAQVMGVSTCLLYTSYRVCQRNAQPSLDLLGRLQRSLRLLRGGPQRAGAVPRRSLGSGPIARVAGKLVTGNTAPLLQGDLLP